MSKRLFGGIIALCLISFILKALPIQAQTPPPILTTIQTVLINYGKFMDAPVDQNEDGIINMIDVAAIIKASLITPTSTPVPTHTPTPIPSNSPTPTPTRIPTSTPTPTPQTGSIIHVPADYATIQAAINTASSGTTILVSAGTYTGSINLNKNVVLQASSFDTNFPKNNKTIIDGAGGSAGVINIPAGLTGMPQIRGFYLRNATSGVLARSPFVLEYNYLTAAGDLGEYEMGSGGVNRGNMYEGAGDDGIDLDHQINDLLIENNYFLNNRQEGMEIRLQDDTISKTAVITIRGNRIEKNGAGGDGDGIQFIDYYKDTNRRFVIERNLFFNNRQSGIGLMDNAVTKEDYRAASIREEIQVINNSFVGNSYGVTGGNNMLILNNVFVSTANLAVKNVDTASIVVSNLFFGNGTNYVGSNVDSATTINMNPLLTADYKLQPGSPAIDAGRSQYTWQSLFGSKTISISSSDFTGAAPDLGRYEIGL